jgi:hypothetical protein
LRKKAEKLGGKKVLVRGSLERRAGVEVKERWIVTASSVEEAVAPQGHGPGKNAGGFHATFRRTDTRIQFESQDDSTVFDITSDFGIDQAVIERQTDNWPKCILIRLHLSGLESFKASNGKITIQWAAADTIDKTRVLLLQGRNEVELTPDNPYWTGVQVVGKKRNTPVQDSSIEILRDKYFELRLPQKLLAENPRSITLAWIDFFRT